jgi:hypothetical protein
MSAVEKLLAEFEAGTLDPARFTHRAHVETAAALLARTDFLDAAQRYQRAIEHLARDAPGKANLTITLAFLSLIAERMARHPDLTPDALLERCPELLEPKLIANWYSRERLGQPEARRRFFMPDRAPAASRI